MSVTSDYFVHNKINKKLIIILLQNIFDIPLGVEPFILNSSGKIWRNFKAYLKKKYDDPSQPILAERLISDQ